ncbi:MAG: hypothetical protein GY804_15360 [Alphaproteobacteria bacterium]|nr:hypothetical protein [Alphaproteobacteria bacterium]
MPRNRKKFKNTEIGLPVDLIVALTTIFERFIDTKKPLSKTNVSTVTGSWLMGTAYVLVNSPNEITQSFGYVLGVIGLGITFYKENKKN